MKQINNIYVFNQDTDKVEEISFEKACHQFSVKHKVPDHGDLEASKVVEGLFMMAAAGEASVPEGAEEYGPFYELAKEALKSSEALSKDFKKQAEELKAQAENAKKQAEELKAQAKQELDGRRNVFLDAAFKAASQADESLRDQLVDMKNHLPTGVGVHVDESGGFSMTFSEDSKEEDLASALGYFVGQERNNDFMKGAYQFMIGEIANELMKRGIYPSMIQCGKALSDKVASIGLSLPGRNIESYGRMAARIPESLRNPRADSTAYLVISDMPYPKKPRKDDYKDKADFELATRQYEEACKLVDGARSDLAGMLKKGEYSFKDEDGKEVTVPMLSKKDILPYVDKAKIELGLKEAPEEAKKSAAFWLRQFYEATQFEYKFLGVHKEGVVRCHKKDGDGTVDLTVNDLAQLREQAINELTVIFFSDKLEVLQKGKEVRDVQVFEVKDGKSVAKKDADGKNVYEKKTFEVFPRMNSLDE